MMNLLTSICCPWMWLEVSFHSMRSKQKRQTFELNKHAVDVWESWASDFSCPTSSQNYRSEGYSVYSVHIVELDHSILWTELESDHSTLWMEV